MTETYFAVLLWVKYIVPIFIISFLIIWIAFSILYSHIQTKRKVKWLKNNGFIRFLKDVASVGGCAFYAWKNGNIILDERDIIKMSYKEMVKQLSLKLNKNSTEDI